MSICVGVLALSVLALDACSEGSAHTNAASASARGHAADPPDAGADAGDDAYPDRVLEIELTVDPADWQKVRSEGRSINRVLSGCLDASFAYSVVPAEVRIDGITLGPIGLRKKGFIGSLSSLRPSLHLDLTDQDASLRFAGRKPSRSTTAGKIRRSPISAWRSRCSHAPACRHRAVRLRRCE